MSHDCRAVLCDEPHQVNDSHSSDCLCEICHDDHDFTAWNIYPACAGCVESMELWIYENADDGLGIRYEYFSPAQYEADLLRWRARQAAAELIKRGPLNEYRKSA